MSSNRRASLKNKSPLDNLFNRQEAGPASKEGPAEQPVLQDKKKDPIYRKTSLLVTEEQLFWLEETCLQARKDSGKVLHKAEIIRALIEVARDVHLDLSGLESEEELAQRLATALRHPEETEAVPS